MRSLQHALMQTFENAQPQNIQARGTLVDDWIKVDAPGRSVPSGSNWNKTSKDYSVTSYVYRAFPLKRLMSNKDSTDHFHKISEVVFLVNLCENTLSG